MGMRKRDNLEILNVAALGGKDNVTVNDVAGTSIRQANIDLSGPGGGADGAADVVRVSGTDQADRVDVTAQGGAIDVGGLHAETHITGGNTDDANRTTSRGLPRGRPRPQPGV